MVLIFFFFEDAIKYQSVNCLKQNKINKKTRKPSSSLVFSVSTNSSSTVESSLTLTSPLLSTPIQFIIKFCGFYPRNVSCLSLCSTSTVLVVGQEMAFKPVRAEEILTFRSVRVVMILKESVYISRSLYIAFANCHKDLPFLAFQNFPSHTL